MKKLLTTIFLAIITLMANADSQQLAFPGADGYAKYVTGGRGGEVCYVTRLDDCSDNNLVPGTLRWALRHDNGGKPRTILFAKSGTIYLTSKLKFQYDNVSILGQSAPGGGITITGFNMYVCKSNVILRYLRFRAGDIPSTSMTGLDVENAKNVIIDHCSMTWSMEECLTAYDTDNTTVQWCIIGEGLYSSKNAKGSRAYATQWGGEHSTMHHTLITNSHSRSPRFNGVRSSSNNKGDHDYQVDSEFANNVIFNWSGTGAIYGGEYDKSKVEIAEWTKSDPGYNRVYLINNYYKPGPSTQKNNTGTFFASPSSPYGQWYASGNKFEETGTYCPWTQAAAQTANSNNLNALNGLSATYKLAEKPYALSGLQYETAEEAYKNVVTKAGASLPRYDEVDRRLLDEAAGKRAPQYHGATLAEAGIIDSPSDIPLSATDQYEAAGELHNDMPLMFVNGTDKYAIDSDADGLPDSFEDANGFNKNDPADASAIAANGYSNLENYLNAIADGTIQAAQYATSTVYVAPGTNSTAESFSIKYDKADAQGFAPDAVTVTNGMAFTIPENTTLFKDGYTLTNWTANGYTFCATQKVVPTENMTLTPVFTKNTVSIIGRTAPVVAVFDASLLQSNGINVTRAKIGESQIDLMATLANGILTVPTATNSYAVVAYADGTSETFSTPSIAVSKQLLSLTVVFPYKKVAEGVSGSGDVTLTWNWEGTADVKAAIVPESVEGAFASVKSSYEGITIGNKTVSGKKCVAFNPLNSKKSASNADYIEFTVTPAEGMKFKATSISWNGAFCGTGGGMYTLSSKVGTAALNAEASGIGPNRDALKAYSYNLTKTTLSSEPTVIRISIYSLDPAKQGVIRDIVISGTYEGSAKPADVYTVTAVVLPANGGTVTYSPDAETYAKDKDVTLTAVPAEGYVFKNWQALDGTIISSNASVVTTADSDKVLKANFKSLADYAGIFENCAPYDAAVDDVNGLLIALGKANGTDRYRIFLHNGTYDFGTIAKTAVKGNVSLIGESMDGVLLLNNPGAVSDYQNQTPVLFIDQNQNNVYMQDLTIRQNRDWEAKKSQGQCIALRQRGKFAAYKNVTIQGVQDTYYLNKADASAYFEDCTLAGEVDFIYGDGTMFFQNCTLNPISSNAVITASNAQTGYKGIVFNECTIDGVAGYALGRPWGDSPAVTYLNTTMRQLPQAAGWKSMTAGLVCRFHEYNSMDAQGNALDLSARSIAACSAAAGSDACVIDKAAANDYTLEKTFEKWQEWKPAELTAQKDSPTPRLIGTNLSWAAAEGALGYAVCKDGKVIALTNATSLAVPSAEGVYTIRTANMMGGLGVPSASAIVIGDLNGDGKISMEDANIAVNSKDYTIEDAKAIVDTYLKK